MARVDSRLTGPRLARRSLGVEYLTIGWNVIEAAVAVVTGVIAASVALTAFGIDSGIELVSAAIVAVRLRSLIVTKETNEEKERRALRVVAVCFYALAVYVLVDATLTLSSGEHPAASPIGIGVTVAALVVMPALAAAKRHLANRFDADRLSGFATILRADAAETALCAVLAGTTLLGLGLNALFGWWWADPTASLVVVYFAVNEGREAWRGELVCADDD